MELVTLVEYAEAVPDFRGGRQDLNLAHGSIMEAMLAAIPGGVQASLSSAGISCTKTSIG